MDVGRRVICGPVEAPLAVGVPMVVVIKILPRVGVALVYLALLPGQRSLIVIGLEGAVARVGERE